MMHAPPEHNDQQSAVTPVQPVFRDMMPAERLIFGGILIALTVMVGIFLIRPLYDPDFFWHLKTGEWIWQNRSLPHIDPFGINPDPAPAPRTEFILTSYWLIQIAMYSFYLTFGMTGIIIFRFIVLAVWLFMWQRWTNIRDLRVTTVIALGSILLLDYYFIERPQFISFLCFGLLLVVTLTYLEHSSVRSMWSILAPLTLIMILWSNMHGGYIIGQAVLIYLVFVEGFKFFFCAQQPLSFRAYRILCISAVAALLASFITPNAFNVIKYLPEIFDSGSYVNNGILEQMSIFEYYRETSQGTALLYAVMVVITACALFTSNYRKNSTWIGIIAITAFMGCKHMRLMPFFLITSLIFLTRYLETHVVTVKCRIIIYCMVAATTLVCFADEIPRRYHEPATGWIPERYFPVAATKVISAGTMYGNIFTTLDWGGYVIWKAGPRQKVFFDGRFLSILHAWEYNNCLIGISDQHPYWKGLFKNYEIGVAILPVYNTDGTNYQLTQSIASDAEWIQVYRDDYQVVLVKNPSIHEAL